LSGGERARVSLAKLMLKNANVLIFDEPTNHLDLYSKEALEAALIDYEGTLLFVSHDRYFLNKMADRVLEMSRDGIQYFLGNYDDYLEKKNELVELQQLTDANPAASNSKASPTPSRQANAAHTPGGPEPSVKPAALSYEEEKRAKREERARQRRLEQLEEEIARFEEQIAAAEKQLLDPANFNDYIKLQQLNESLEKDRQRLEELVEEWGSLLE
jgi:ATP-binding cassette subfamily F protein 3